MVAPDTEKLNPPLNVDFICEIDGKTLIGDIKTNGDKRRYEWDGKGYDFSKPVSDYPPQTQMKIDQLTFYFIVLDQA